jgi:hypothetical protein
MPFLRFVLPIGGFLGVIPAIKVFGVAALERSFVQAGFDVEHRWSPGPGAAMFHVLRKPARLSVRRRRSSSGQWRFSEIRDSVTTHA